MQQITPWHKDTAARLAASICPPADKSAPMRAFTVTIGSKKAPRLTLEVMARSSFEAQERHLCLLEIGERIEVDPILSPAEQFHEANDAAALRSQCAAQVRSEWSAR